MAEQLNGSDIAGRLNSRDSEVASLRRKLEILADDNRALEVKLARTDGYADRSREIDSLMIVLLKQGLASDDLI